MAIEPRKTEPLHRRTIEVDAYDDGGSVVLVGWLRDARKPLPGEDADGGFNTVHHMELRVRVDLETHEITDADAMMHAFPHAECPAVTDAFRKLIGLRIGPGYNKSVKKLFAGPAGCTHLDHLARILGPVMIQAQGSLMWQKVELGRAEAPEAPHELTRDSCHVWRTGGPGEEKIRLGWKAGPPIKTVPPVSHFREEGRSGTSQAGQARGE